MDSILLRGKIAYDDFRNNVIITEFQNMSKLTKDERKSWTRGHKKASREKEVKNPRGNLNVRRMKN